MLLALTQSIRAQIDTTHVMADSLVADTTALSPDSIVNEATVVTMPMSSGALEEEVKYTAQDSIVYDIVNKMVYLYGVAVIDYQELHLEAEEIVIDWTKNELKAYSKMDSLRRKVKEQLKMSDKGREGEADSIAYNFKSKKGKIYNFRTQEGNGYVHVDAAKKNADNVMYASNAKYTTCDRKEPHFWLQLNKAKIIPSDKVVTSYAYVVIEDIPLYPVAVPFGFFPTNTTEATSGILFPKYGFSQGRGYFLTDGGYYFALSDKMDLSLTGDIFSYGSWGLSGQTNYKKRYKHSGSAQVDFNTNFYDNGEGEFEPQKEFKIGWTHRQDPKSIPSMTFSSNVNAGTSNFNRNNSFNNNEILDSRLRSSVNFSKNFQGTPFRATVALNHDQNLQDRKINLSLPTTNLSMDRINPFDKVRSKKLLFLRNLGFSHTLNFENRLSTYDSMLFKPDEYDLEWDRGISHRLPINTTFKVLKWISVNPSFNYRGYYNFYDEEKFLNDSLEIETFRNQTNSYAFDYNFSTTLNTTLYGMFRFKRSKNLVALRHAVVPSINLNYTPDFTTERWGYFDEVPTSLEPDENGDINTQRYNRYSGNPLGAPQAGKTGSIGFGLNNTWELKLRDKKDTVNLDATKKVKVIESLSINGNYNFFADSLNLSDITIRGRTILFKTVNINSGLVLDPYALDENGRNYNEYLWDVEGKLADIQSFNFNASMSVKRALIQALFKKGGKPQKQSGIESPKSAYYTKYSFPFDVRITYDYTSRRNLDEYDAIQTIGFTGSFEPTDKWRTQYTINYDLVNNDVGYTNIKFVRDLHCWEFSFDWTPTGARKGFFFSLRARATEFAESQT